MLSLRSFFLVVVFPFLISVGPNLASAGSPRDQAQRVKTSDNRKRVANTRVFSAVGFLQSKSPGLAKGKVSVCTGTLVSPKQVLTAAHCVYNSLGFTRSVDFVPAASGPKSDSDWPFGMLHGSTVHVPHGYSVAVKAGQAETRAGFKYDFAIVDLQEPVVNITPIPVVEKETSFYEDATVGLFSLGYPNEMKTMTQWYALATDHHYLEDGLFGHSAYLSHGDSGGPVLYVDPSTHEPVLVGISVSGPRVNLPTNGAATSIPKGVMSRVILQFINSLAK